VLLLGSLVLLMSIDRDVVANHQATIAVQVGTSPCLFCIIHIIGELTSNLLPYLHEGLNTFTTSLIQPRVPWHTQTDTLREADSHQPAYQESKVKIFTNIGASTRWCCPRGTCCPWHRTWQGQRCPRSSWRHYRGAAEAA
jgi:hypothetical protein